MDMLYNDTVKDEQKQGLIDCYRIALDFGLAAGNLAAEQVRLQEAFQEPEGLLQSST